jgi:acyl carrier protein
MSDVMENAEERSAKVNGFKAMVRGERRELTPAERQLVGREIIGFLAEQCDMDPASVGPDADLEHDLGVDSLTFLELFQELESQYDLDLEIRTVARYARDNPVRTVGELVDQICLFLENRIDLGAAD